MGKKLYVGGLAYQTTEDQLKELFSEHGTVVEVIIIKDRDTGNSKGFGFVEMATVEQAQAAITNLNSKEFAGRSLTVNEAKPQEDRAPRR